MPGSFFDTNVLLYIASGDPGKADRAESLLRDGGKASVQVLNELANVARRKMRLSWVETRGLISMLRDLLSVHPVTIEIHETGLAVSERYGLSIWDSMIAAAALHIDCDTLWSEDMQHGLMIDGRLRVANPFHG